MGVEGRCGREGDHFNGAVKRRISLPRLTAMLTSRAPVGLRQGGEMPSHALWLLRSAVKCHAAIEMLSLPAHLRGDDSGQTVLVL